MSLAASPVQNARSGSPFGAENLTLAPHRPAPGLLDVMALPPDGSLQKGLKNLPRALDPLYAPGATKVALLTHFVASPYARNVNFAAGNPQPNLARASGSHPEPQGQSHNLRLDSDQTLRGKVKVPVGIADAARIKIVQLRQRFATRK